MVRVGHLVLAQMRYCWWPLDEGVGSLGRSGVSISRCISTDVDSSFIVYFKEGEYKKALGQLVAATQEWAMFENPRASEILA